VLKAIEGNQWTNIVGVRMKKSVPRRGALRNQRGRDGLGTGGLNWSHRETLASAN